MQTTNFKKWNNILGWVAFAIALITYTLTLEPTLSFWDAGEYIATSTKLQVGHPPGAPLYQMLGAFFSMFAGSSENIAFAVNMVAAVSSAFAILFIFWSSTNILSRVVSTYKEIDKNTAYAILGSTFIGALTFAFSDTFWFSAVEAEVYATATMLIALLLWLGLRWVDDLEKERGNKWLLLIALVIGMSFGVHFMALLTIPSIGFLYYFKKYPQVTVTNFIVANVAMVVILFFAFMFMLPWTMQFFGRFEIFAVNSLGLPFNSGTILAFVFIVAFFVFGLRYTRQKEKHQANTVILSFLFVFIGFSCWLMLPIRANSDITINENKPSDSAELLAYYNREQYGSRSLFYDTYFTTAYRQELDEKTPYVDEVPNYERDTLSGKYVIVNQYKNAEQNVSRELKGFLPRMWSTDGQHPLNYMVFTEPLDFEIKSEFAGDQQLQQLAYELKSMLKSGEISLQRYHAEFLQNPEFSEYFEVQNPTFGNNVKFMFEYQFGYMYWRYLMWNFSGRQNDIQGHNDRMNGNWVTGINFLDEIRLGSQKNLPSDVLNNKGRNHYYMLPFILGLIGIIFHFRRDKKTFYVLLVLFLFTSFALKIFLNERPFEPRERDYAVVASFMIFAVWVGFGVYSIYDELSKRIKPKVALPIVMLIGLLASPVLLAKENWDDHDRSDRYTALATAKAYLDSCEPNAIIFTIGDNDTFPLWYLQEVEGYRTDVRVVCTALLQADWYIDQMKLKAYESDPLKIRFDHTQYNGRKLYQAFVVPEFDERIELNSLMEYIASDDPRTKVQTQNLQEFVRIPTNKIRLTVDKEQIIENEVVSEKYYDDIVPYIDFDIRTSYLYRMRIIMLDIIANNNWERPIYFTGGAISDEDFLWMKDYLQLAGYAYQLVPLKTPVDRNDPNPLNIGGIDTEKMYETVTNWNWGNYGSEEIYHDPETRKNSLFFRIYMARLSEQLIAEGQLRKAKDIVDLAIENFPIDYYGNYETVEPFAEMYYVLGEKQKADEIISRLTTKYDEQLYFYQSMKPDEQNEYGYEVLSNLHRMENLILMAREFDSTITSPIEEKLKGYRDYFVRFLRAAGVDDDSLRAREQMEMQQQIDMGESIDSLIETDSLHDYIFKQM